MSSKKIWFKIRIVFATLVLTALGAINTRVALADPLQNRTVRIGSSFASQNTNHDYSFRIPTSSTVGSIVFEYCSNSALFEDPCFAPSGLDGDSFSIAQQSGVTGFTPHPSSTASKLVITRTPITVGPVDVQYSLNNIINPDDSYQTVYVKISVYPTADGSGSAEHQGAVAFVVEDAFDIDAYVPPYLTFCVALRVELDCSDSSGYLADFGEFNQNSTKTATSQMSASTNDLNGYNIYLSGQTMTSGNNIIPALSSPSSSILGQSQFGLNLRKNNSPSVGSDPEQGFVGSGAAVGDYSTPDYYVFRSGDIVAGSAVSSGFTRYTSSYIVNVSANQKPGIYATSILYTAMATF